MVLWFSLSNFFSIKDTITVSFEAEKIATTSARDLADNVFTAEKKQYLKTVGIFGPNASGKSSIYKALLFCTRLILDSHNNHEGGNFNFVPFKFDGYHEQPSAFAIRFVCGGTEYEYAFSLNQKEIISESLRDFSGGRGAKVFLREEKVGKPKNQIYSFGEGCFVRPLDVAQSTGRSTLFISRAAQMDRELAKKIYQFFLGEFYVGLPLIPNQYAVEVFKRNKKLLLEALRMADSDIVDMEIRKERVTVPALAQDPRFGVQPAMQQKIIPRFLTKHKRNPDIQFDLLTEESEGTVQIFSLLLVLLDICQNGKTLVADEFDLRLHSAMSDFIINLIHASDKAQFLFTSHNTNLISTKKFRRDQICFTNKKEDGSTEFYSLYDFKDFRENMDAEKGYLQGRFDAVPYTAASVESIKKLFE